MYRRFEQHFLGNTCSKERAIWQSHVAIKSIMQRFAFRKRLLIHNLKCSTDHIITM